MDNVFVYPKRIELFLSFSLQGPPRPRPFFAFLFPPFSIQSTLLFLPSENWTWETFLLLVSNGPPPFEEALSPIDLIVFRTESVHSRRFI